MFFFAINRTTGAPPLTIDPQAVICRLMPFAPPDASGFAINSNSILAHCLHWNTSRSRLETTPFRHAESGMEAASWARLDNRNELAAKLDISASALASMGDTELILHSYLQWGEQCVDHLIGDFVFVIHDRKHNTVFCGRDHMGVRPFYYFVSDELFVCATSLSAFRQVSGVALEVDPQWIAEYLLQLSMSFDRTAYQGIQKLPPAHCLTITPHALRLQKYFELSAEPELKLKDSRDYVAAYREVLEEAIRCRLDSDYPIGCELSGGVDSSTITAFAARLLPQPATQLHTFGFTFFEFDQQYIMEVCRECRLADSHIFTRGGTSDPAVLRKRALTQLGYPVEHGNAVSHEPFYRLAEQLGIRTLLSGFGGDEFGTTTHGHLALLELAVQGRYAELFNILPGNPFFRLLRLLKLEWRRRNSANFTTTLHRPELFDSFHKRWPHRVLHDDLVTRYSLKEQYYENARFDAGYSTMKKFILEKRWHPFVPTRMENCSLLAASRMIDYRWPLLDVRLVKVFLSIPSHENYYRGMGRYLHRRAISGVVPDKVAWHGKKNMGALLDVPQNAERHWLQIDFDTLHPQIKNFIDVYKLQQQLEELQTLSGNNLDERRVQFISNIRVVREISSWLYHLEGEFHDQ